MKLPAKKRAHRKAIAADLVVGANVRQLRVDAGLTLLELAEALGISHQQLQKYETGASMKLARTGFLRACSTSSLDFS